MLMEFEFGHTMYSSGTKFISKNSWRKLAILARSAFSSNDSILIFLECHYCYYYYNYHYCNLNSEHSVDLLPIYLSFSVVISNNDSGNDDVWLLLYLLSDLTSEMYWAQSKLYQCTKSGEWIADMQEGGSGIWRQLRVTT